MFFIQKNGFSNLTDVVRDAVTQLKSIGFTEVFGSIGSGVPTPANPVTGAPELPNNNQIDITLEAPSSFKLSTQKWRIKFYGKVTTQTLKYTTPGGLEDTVEYNPPPKVLSVFVGSDTQLPNNGSWGFVTNPSQSSLTNFVSSDAAGHIAPLQWGNIATPDTGYYPPASSFNTRGYFFYSRAEFGDDQVTAAANNTQAYRNALMNYCISYTSRGLFFSIWDTSTISSGQRMSWFLVQRSVDRITGKVRGMTSSTIDSQCPLFCVFGCESSVQSAMATHEYGIMVVREKNINPPSTKRIFSPTVISTSNGSTPTKSYADLEDASLFINPCKQVSFNEQGDYIVTFISELASPRYKYPDELDMVGTISADVVGFEQELQFTVYGESQPRTYIALPANDAFNTGMRLLILKQDPNELA